MYNIMARRLCSRLPSLSTLAKTQLQNHVVSVCPPTQIYSSNLISQSPHLLPRSNPIFQEFREEWARQMEDDEDHLWTASEDDENDPNSNPNIQLKKDIKKAKQRARARSEPGVDADDSDELRSIWSPNADSDDEKSLWTGDEGDDEADVPTDPIPNERSDEYIDRLFEFDEKPKHRTLAQTMRDEDNTEDEEMSPGKRARKLAVQSALRKLRKGPDGRYVNVWEVMSDLDVLIGVFENIVSGPDYEEMKKGGPKKLNMEFFKEVQAKMRDPNYDFSPELKLRPKGKVVPRRKWEKAQSRRRKVQRR
ncbi:ATP synthase subunit delta [Striga asiatica]|uniref:ATP synthase subunit delta n=1 Tax=Striga asiatica TaxID=4170 RepID=A0A5A7QZW6_STRAF|nr:ATP synthase subunit delta [Striga asiatica]